MSAPKSLVSRAIRELKVGETRIVEVSNGQSVDRTMKSAHSYAHRNGVKVKCEAVMAVVLSTREVVDMIRLTILETPDARDD